MQSSAQLPPTYPDPAALVGRLVIAVVNFPPRRIAGFQSEVLVLGALPADGRIPLLRSTTGASAGRSRSAERPILPGSMRNCGCGLAEPVLVYAALAPGVAEGEDSVGVRPAGREPGRRLTSDDNFEGRQPCVAVCGMTLRLDQRTAARVGAVLSMDAKQVWRAALGELQVSLSPANFETWLKETALVAVDDNRFRVAVPNGFAKDWLETRYRSLISQTLARVVGYSVTVDFEVREGLSTVDRRRRPMAAAPAPAGHRCAWSPAASAAREGGSASLNPRYTFRNFIVGSANRLAHAASLSVAERPGHAYNPLFLYGGVGLGKTHLMHAIGNQVLARFPRKRVVYATSEKFTNEFITASSRARSTTSASRYRRIDLLLIDDIQFIADKERTQEEFFHTFNAIHEDGKQIVLSSDRPPKLITTLEERLRSRFEWGLIADLTAPDLETRIAILRAKAEEQAASTSARTCWSSSRARSSATSASSRARSTGSSPTPTWAACRSPSSSPRPCCRTCSTTPSDAWSRRSASSRPCPSTTASSSTRSRARSATGRSSCRARSRCT